MMMKIFSRRIAKYATVGLVSTCSLTGGYIHYKSTTPSEQMVILLDMDETFLYSHRKSSQENCNNSNATDPDFDFDIEDQSSGSRGYYVWLRPGVSMLLPVIAKFNKLYLYTTGTTQYAKHATAVTKVDQYFPTMICREDRAEYKQQYKKSYGIDISGKPFEIVSELKTFPGRIVLIDDRKDNFNKQDAAKDNSSFYHIPKFNKYTKFDTEFYKVFAYLLYLNIQDDVKRWFASGKVDAPTKADDLETSSVAVVNDPIITSPIKNNNVEKSK